MRIGYFGGSFDPPHNGHLAVACAAAEAFQLDRILFVPSASQPLKPDGTTATYIQRLRMIALLCADAPAGMNCTPSDLESPSKDGEPHYTVNTLQRLCTSLTPSDALFVLVGADAFFDLRRWREPELLLGLAEWIVVSRPGFSLSRLGDLPLTPEQMSHVHWLDTLNSPVSATLIRKELSAGESCADMLPAKVFDYIREQHLYGT